MKKKINNSFDKENIINICRKIQKNFIYLLDKMVFIKYGDLQACSWKSKLLKLFSCFVSRRRLGEMIEKIMEWEKKETKYVGIMYYTDSNPYTGISGYENDMMLRKWYKDPVWLPFEDALIMTISEPEKDLLHRYGPNYAKPYPEEKRIAKHGIIGIISQSANREI